MEDIGDDVVLPCDLNTALELWTAWRDHGILARAGGYLDQPRWWRTVIRFINSRHEPIHAAYMATQFPKKPESEHGYDGDLPMAEGWGGLNWIE